MGFTEGPVWVDDGQYLFFTDIPHNRIMRWNGRKLSVWSDSAHFAIGLYLDKRGRLLSCEHTTRSLARYDLATKKRVVLARSYRGKVLNSTNDVCIRSSDGAIFFTDPPFGIHSENDDRTGGFVGYQQGMEHTFCGVYKVTAEPDAPVLLTDKVFRPNGLCFSRDEKILYIGDSSQQFHQVYAFDVTTGDKLRNMRVFAVMPTGVPDGMRTDVENRLYVYRADGVLLGRINMPEMVTNCCFGGPDHQRLYITATSSLYAIDLAVKG